MKRFLGVLIVALVLAPSAGAWTTIATGVSNSADPALLDDTDLVAYSTGTSLRVIRNGQTQTIRTSAFVGDPRIVRTDSGLLLFVGTEAGIVTYSAPPDGSTWILLRGALTGSRVADVQGATTDGGVIYVSQDGTDFIDIWNWNNDTRTNAFPYCCGYGESLAADSNGGKWIAFWSNATGQSGYLFGPFGGPYQNLSGGADTPQRTDRVPLVAGAGGNVFTAWATGSAVHVDTFAAGAKRHEVTFGGSFSGSDPHLALAADAQNDVWAVWSGGGAVHVARSCSAGAHFGRTTSARAPGTVYGLEAAAQTNAVNVIVNNGSALQERTFVATLSVHATRKSATVVDDVCPVAGAKLHGGGKTTHTNAQGKASLKGFKRHALVHVTASGYAPTSFRVP